MEFNTDRNTEEVENIAAAENDVGQRLDIYLAAKTRGVALQYAKTFGGRACISWSKSV